MTYFYILFILLFVASLVFRDNKRLGIFMILLMAFMCAFRGINVGSDTIEYYNNNFSNEFSLESGSSYDAEFLFVLLTNIITDLGLNTRWCLFSLSIVTCLFLLLAVKRFNLEHRVSYVLVAFFFFILGLYAMSFNIARQIAASTIILYAYTFLNENGKKRYLYFFFILLASSIHLSSVIFIPFYFIRRLKFDWFSEHIYVTIISATALYVIVQLYKETMLSSISSNIILFSVYGHLVEGTEHSNVSIAGFVFEIAEFVILLLYFRKISQSGFKTLASLLFLSVFITIALSAFYGNINRMRIGLTIVEPIALSSALSRGSKLSRNDLFLFFATSLIFGYGALSSLNRGAYDIIPYYMSF